MIVLLSKLGHVTYWSGITAVLWTFVWEVLLLSLGETSVAVRTYIMRTGAV